jgi:hypothetical protein
MTMRLLVCLGCVAPLAGCHLATNIARNAYNEPAEIHDEYKVVRQLRREGHAAFAEVKRQYPRRAFSHDFECGFVDGYQDYLDNGGKADIPPMPPLHYRRAKYLNPEGHAKIRDYFLGFKHGVDVAVATGCRPFYTVPILVAEQGELPPLNITVLPPPPDPYAPTPKLGSPLPLPQEVKPGTGSSPAPTPTQPPTPAPGLGNPVAPMPGGSSVPILPGAVPAPNPPAGTPAPKTPPSGTPGPGGKSARTNGATPGEFVSVTSVELPSVPPTAEKGPILTVPPPAAPLYDVPPPRPTNR